MPVYDRAGRRISVEEWGTLSADPGYQRVAEDQVGAYWVSTVWLGLDHGHGRTEQPIIFETMVFAGDHDVGPDLDTRRYSSEAEARAGHEETVVLLRATVQEEAPHDVGRMGSDNGKE